MVDAISYIVENLAVAGPAILMGAAIPCLVLLGLFLSKHRKSVPFNAVFHGAGTFLLVLVGIVVLILALSNTVLPMISISQESDADVYIYAGGAIILLFFYVAAEMLRLMSFKNLAKGEKNVSAGLTFGSGFILAQNLLVLGLIYAADIDLGESAVFGILMIISGVIYLLNSAIGYRLVQEGQPYVGFALASSYYLMFLVMLIFSNVYVTYLFVSAVLAFNLVIGYVMLPLPFKKKKGDEE